MNYRSPCIDPLTMSFPRTFFIYNVIPTTINENTSDWFWYSFQVPKIHVNESFFGIANTIEIQHSLATGVARICDTPELFGEAPSFQSPR